MEEITSSRYNQLVVMAANYVKTGREDLKEINLITEKEKDIYEHEKGLPVLYICPID